MDRQIDGWINGGWMDKWMDGLMDGQMDGWINGEWMDEWLDGPPVNLETQ